MTQTSTLSELFAHADWARDNVFAAAAGLPESALDREFPIGFGSLREVLKHIYGAERLWCERLGFVRAGEFPRTRFLLTLGDVRDAHRRLGDVRNACMARLTDEVLDETLTYQTSQGQPLADRRRDILLHMAGHGVHHRAQVLNMLRRVGAQPPGVDYLFMKLERPSVAISHEAAAKLRSAGFVVGEQPTAAPALSVELLRRCLAYGDWAWGLVTTAAAALTDEQLDRPLEIGLGTLRKTLLHIRDAEQWWLENWRGEAVADFPKLGEETTIEELQAFFRATASARDVYLAGLTDENLARPVPARVRPGLELGFRLGESVVQLWYHGTHHRAQAVNLLRQLGATPVPLDFVLYTRLSADDRVADRA